MSETHIVPVRIYVFVFLALLLGTFLTVLASRYDLGEWNLVIALAIAVSKTMLVVLYFMHVRYSEKLIWVVVGGGFAWILILLGLTFSDYFSRLWLITYN